MATSVLITGASGLIGARLTALLLERGCKVSHLGREPGTGSVPKFIWDVDKGEMDLMALQGVDCIIHLAGAGVADERWSTARKKVILESRTQSGRLLHDTLANGNHQVTSLVSASAIGYYGFGFESEFKNEADRPGNDFLAQVVVAWEKEIDKIESPGCRIVKLRIGIVLSESGGALVEMARPVRWGFGAALGTGRQDVSWIHLDDLCGIFIKAIEDPTMNGAYNAVSPNPVTNLELTRTIASALRRPLWLPPVPGWVLHGLIGEMAEVVLHGSRISADKILKAGYQFKHENIQEAVMDLLVPRKG